MATYNVLVPVVALIEADSPEQAMDKLAEQLRLADFDPYEGGIWNAFESED